MSRDHEISLVKIVPGHYSSFSFKILSVNFWLFTMSSTQKPKAVGTPNIMNL